MVALIVGNVMIEAMLNRPGRKTYKFDEGIGGEHKERTFLDSGRKSPVTIWSRRIALDSRVCLASIYYIHPKHYFISYISYHNTSYHISL